MQFKNKIEVFLNKSKSFSTKRSKKFIKTLIILLKVNNFNWDFDKTLVDMKEGEIVTRLAYKFQVYNSKFGDANQKKYVKILERIK